jgi:hypothetical protein
MQKVAIVSGAVRVKNIDTSVEIKQEGKEQEIELTLKVGQPMQADIKDQQIRIQQVSKVNENCNQFLYI